MKNGIVVTLLAYKEAENLKVLIPQIIEVMSGIDEEYEIMVVDTEKPLDETPEVCKEFGARYVNQRYPRFGGAFRTAIEEAYYDKFLILDGDGSHPPKYIDSMYRKFIADKHDVVIGSRYTKGGITTDAKTSIVMSKILNFCYSTALGIKAKDVSTDFRLYKTELLKGVSLECVNYDILEEVLLKIRLNNGGISIGEVPIDFQKRIYGESKRQLLPFIWSYIKTLFKLTWMRMTYKKSK